MLISEWTPTVVAVLAFCAMASVVFVVGQHYKRVAHLNRRLPIPPGATLESGVESGGGIAGLVARHFDEKRLGLDATKRSKLRLTLVQAGYFRRDAANFYVFWRLAAVVLLPCASYLLFALTVPNTPIGPKLIAIAIAGALGLIAPDAFISRKRRRLADAGRRAAADNTDDSR